MTIVATQEVNVGGSYSVVVTIQDITDEFLNALENNTIYVKFTVLETIDDNDFSFKLYVPCTGIVIETDNVKLKFPIFHNALRSIYELVDIDDNKYGQFQFEFTSINIIDGFIETYAGATIRCPDVQHIFVAKRQQGKGDVFEYIQSDTYSFTSTGYHSYYAFKFNNGIINGEYKFNQYIYPITGIRGCEYNEKDGLILLPANGARDIMQYDIYLNGEVIKSITSNSNIKIPTDIYRDGDYIIKTTNTSVWYDLPAYFEYTVNTGQIEIRFYYNGSEDIEVSKVIEDELILYGKLKTSTSIINPEIVINFQDVFNYNYCYIPAFHRYYYITDITSLRTGLWQISMSVDVLMSYKNKILPLSGIISRNEFEYDNLLIDNKVPSKLDYKYTVYDYNKFKTVIKHNQTVAEYEWGLDYSNVMITTFTGKQDTFKSNVNIVYGDYNKSPNIQSTLTTYVFSGISSSINIDGIEIRLAGSDIIKYFWEKVGHPDFLSSMLDLFANLSDGIVSYNLSPLNIVSANYALSIPDTVYQNVLGIGDFTKIKIGNNDVDLVGEWDKVNYAYPILDNNRTRMWAKIKDIIETDNFIDRTSYSKYVLYLPYIGFVDLDVTQIVNNLYQYIVYDIDIVSGDFIAYMSKTDPADDVRNNNGTDINYFIFNKPLHEYWYGNLYTPLPIGGTNANEIHKNMLLSGIELIGNVVSHGISLGSSVSKASTMLTPKKKHISKKGKELISKAKTKFTSEMVDSVFTSSLEFISAMTPSISVSQQSANILKNRNVNFPYIIKCTPNYYYPDDYNHNFGRPLQQTRILSNVHGYTEVGVIHLIDINDATVDELNEIEDLLLSGVILP